MKRRVFATLLILLTVCAFSVAVAEEDTTPHGFTLNCTAATSIVEPHYEKLGTRNYISVRLQVIGSGSSAGYSIAVSSHCETHNMTYGTKWIAPNSVYYSVPISSRCSAECRLAPAIRCNAKYFDVDGLPTVQVGGQFIVY